MHRPHSAHAIPLASGERLALGPTALVMGIINATPDSFSDGGRHATADAALAHARLLLAEGADILDIGGESTRPGASAVPMQEELNRVIPVFETIAAAEPHAILSVDTSKALVADQALQSGAAIINDVGGLQHDPEIADVAALHRCPVIAMHWDKARNRDKPLVAEMRRFFERTLDIADKAGIARNRLIFDPGFGFGKTLAENYALLTNIAELCEHLPILFGTSRKSMIGKILAADPADRLAGTLATTVLGYTAGAHIFRVHDVKANRDALRVAQAALYGPATGLDAP